MSDYLPLGEIKQAEWYQSFVTKLKAVQSSLGLPDTQISALQNDSNVLSHLVNGVQRAHSLEPAASDLGELEAYKNLLKDGPSERLRQMFPTDFTPAARRTRRPRRA